MRIRWTSDLATGVRTIDLQHEELIAILNELDTVQRSGGDLSVMDDVFQRLKAYTIFHIGTEETYMVGLPNGAALAAEHHQQHQHFIDELERMHTNSLGNPADAMKRLLDFLNEWLYSHILISDRKLAVLLNESKATESQSPTHLSKS